MERIKLNHWYIKENELSISLMRYYVMVYPISCNNQVSYVLNVMDDENNKTLYFDTLEESVKFTEEVINSCNNITEITNNYNDYLEKQKVYRK